MNKKKVRKKYWEGIPRQLRLMCRADMSGLEGYCTKPILDYLIDNLDSYDSFYNNTTPYDIIHQIDVVMERMMYPLKTKEDDWRAYMTEITEILNYEDGLLQKYAPVDYKTGYISSYRKSPNIVEQAQKLNIFRSTLYICNDDYESLKKSLKQVLYDSQRNIKHLLYEETTLSERYSESSVNWDLQHYEGLDSWEPIYWLGRENIWGDSRMIYTDMLERYALSFYGYKGWILNSDTYVRLCDKAEKCLQIMCDIVLDNVVDQLGEPDEDRQSLLSDRDKYESMYERSQERLQNRRK